MLIVVVGIWTWSLKKMMVTYVVGMLLICGLLLPDWDFFDRHYSRWCFPITSQERATLLAQRSASNRYRIYPIRLICYTAIYGFTLYKCLGVPMNSVSVSCWLNNKMLYFQLVYVYLDIRDCALRRLLRWLGVIMQPV
ncbi:hypothetical protein ACFE04_013602 [Oxalis oulophora]